MSEKDKEIAREDADKHKFQPEKEGIENFQDYVEAYNERNKEIMKQKKSEENDG